MKKYIVASILLLVLSSCSTNTEDITLSSLENTTEGLNLFTIDEEQGIIKGAYIEGEYRVNFEARRGGARPWGAILMDPTLGYSLGELIKNPQLILYDVSACYISKSGDPFIVQDYCSIPPLCLPTDDQQGENCQIDDSVRTKEFELAEKTAQEINNITFPKSLQREKESLVDVGNIRELISSSPASSIPNN